MRSTKIFENRLTLEIIAIATLTGGLFFLLGRHKVSLGIAIGALAGIINLKLLVKDAKKKVTAISLKKNTFFSAGYLVRYVIMGIALLLASSWGLACLVGGAIGLFCLRLAIYLDRWNPQSKS